MSCRLAEYVASNGPVITVGTKTFEVAHISEDGGIVVAAVKAKRSEYTAIRCNDSRVIGAPGAEVWSILGHGRGRQIAQFAIHEGQIKALC